MKDIQLLCGTDGGLWHRVFGAGLLVLLSGFVTGCATTETAQTQPKTVTALAKASNAYVVRRAAVRTPAVAGSQQHVQQKGQALRAVKSVHRSAASHSTRLPNQLTKAQYHARYQAQKRAEAKAAQDRRRAAILASIARKKAEEAAIRKRYVAKWEKKQQKRLAYNKNWQQEQLAKKKLAQIAARKAELQRQLAALKATQKTAAARKPVPQRKQVVAQKRPDPRAKYLARWNRMQAEKRLEAKRAEQRVERVIYNAKKQIGRKYVWGGASPKRGFDCSGLVQHSINKGATVSVPRTALQQYRASIKVPAHNAERGDLVFFITRGKRVSHVGIYLGGDKFVHAPRTGRTVTTSRLKGYWKKRFVGFGRIPGACRLPMPRV